MTIAICPTPDRRPSWGSLLRRTFASLAILNILIFGLPAVAGATRTAVTLKLKGIPIAIDPTASNGPTYPGTGNLLGKGTAVEGELRITGTEYGGFPPPLTGVMFLVPAGVKLHPQGFPTCSIAILESHEVAHCPKKSAASSVGSVTGVVSFGETRVHETLTLQVFFAPSGELAFYAEGTSPTVIEVLGRGTFTSAGATSGPQFSAAVPLVETVPGAPYGVVEAIKLKIGAAFKQDGKLIPYITLPKTCPKDGFPVRAEFKFLIGEPITVNTTIPCPSK